MFNPRRVLVMVVGLVTLLLAPAAAQAAGTQQQIADVTDNLTTAIQATTFRQATTADEYLSRFVAEYPALGRALDTATTGFDAAAASASNTTFKNFALQFAAASQGMRSALDALNGAITRQDNAAIGTAVGAIPGAYQAMGAAIDDYNSYLKAHPEAGHPLLVFYLVLMILSVAIAIAALAFWLQADGRDPVSATLKRLRYAMLMASILPVVGSAVTYFWYRYAIVHGGSYFVLWGPVVLGFVVFLTRVNTYRQVSGRLRAQQAAGGYPVVAAAPGAPGWTPPSWPPRGQ